MLIHLRPYILLAVLGLIFFGRLVLHPTATLYSPSSDLIAEHIPAKTFLVRSWRDTGELPLWWPDPFGGAPFVHDIQLAAFYPPHWILFLLPPEAVGSALSWLLVAHVILAGWCMYPYARSQGLGQAGAMAAAIGYMFAGKWMFHLLDAGHYILIGLAWLPLLLLLLEAAIRRGSLVRATAAGAVFALIVLSTHPQWTFYSALFAAAWTLGTALESAGDGKWAARSASGIRSTDSRSESATLSAGDGKWAACSASGIRSTDSRSESATLTLTALMRWAGVGMWMALIAGALSAVQLLPMLEAASQASRGPGVPPDDLAREFAPMIHQLVGPSSAVDDRWEQRAGLGVLWLAAALLAPVLRGGRVRWQTGVWVLLWALALGGGTLLQERRWLGFGAFRLHVRLLIVAALPTALLVGVTTDALFEKAAAWSRGRRIVCLVLVAFALTAGVIDFISEFARDAWEGGLSRVPLYAAALFVLIPAGLLLLVTRLRPGWAARSASGIRSTDSRSESATFVTLSWLSLLLLDLWAMSWPLVDGRDERDLYRPSACVRAVIDRREADQTNVRWRVLDCCIDGENGHSALGEGCPLALMYGLETVGGYSPLDVHRFRDYLQLIRDDPEPMRPFVGIFGQPILKRVPVHDKRLVDLLGVRYLLQPRDVKDQPNGHVPAAEPGWRRVLEDDDAQAYNFTMGGVCRLPPYELWENPEAFSRAFVVPRAEPLPDRPRLPDAMKQTDFHQTVLLEDWRDEFAVTPADGAYRAANVWDYRPNRVEVREEGPAGWLVLTDVWFPGWKCTVNGRPTEIHRADFLFRAVAVPSGPCEIVFTFEPESYRRGRELSLGAAALVAILLIGAAAFSFSGRGGG